MELYLVVLICCLSEAVSRKYVLESRIQVKGINSSELVREENVLAWEGQEFSITIKRKPVITVEPLNQTFDGRLRHVSVQFEYITQTVVNVDVIRAGNLASKLLISSSQMPRYFSQSHVPRTEFKTGSFWSSEFAQCGDLSCAGNSKFVSGCKNSTDNGDESDFSLKFPGGVPLASWSIFPYGIFAVC